MADKQTISNYTAADITRYHERKMSAAERHQLEKAALDDPFLSDALEGYAMPADHNIQLNDLQTKLQERLGKENKKTGAVFTMSRFLRVAALFIVLAGAGLLIWQSGLLNNKKDAQNIAQAPEQPAPVTSDNSTATPSLPDSAPIPDAGASEAYPFQSDTIRKRSAGSAGKEITSSNDDVNAKPAELTAPSRDITSESRSVAEDKPLIRNSNTMPSGIGSEQAAAEVAIAEKKEAAKVKAAAPVARSNAYLQNNIYKGRVVDNDNNPLPFANIINTKDNVGTYTDARGFFALTSPDSALNVQVKSLGFSNKNVKLQRNAGSNEIVLKEDNSNVNQVVISNSNVNAVRARSGTLVFEEPEPEDGWDKYDHYLVNNIVPPDEVSKDKGINGSQVELSFDVNKYGEPVNIKVEKSVCQKCDEEAIRLVKEGPKWKKKNRKSRATVTVAF